MVPRKNIIFFTLLTLAGSAPYVPAPHGIDNSIRIPRPPNAIMGPASHTGADNRIPSKTEYISGTPAGPNAAVPPHAHTGIDSHIPVRTPHRPGTSAGPNEVVAPHDHTGPDSHIHSHPTTSGPNDMVPPHGHTGKDRRMP